ncbi:putative head-tail joining [Achromobacter phage nyashin_LB6]|nr:putative head-tail joining [Achromobacter phage nyashin_LB6]
MEARIASTRPLLYNRSSQEQRSAPILQRTENLIMKNYPKINITTTNRDDLEAIQSAFIHAAYALESKSQDYICYALEAYQLRIRSIRVSRMTETEQYMYRWRRRGVVLARMIVRDSLSPRLSFIQWMRQNNTDAPEVTVNSLGMTALTYESKLRAKLEAYRPHRIEWVNQIVSIINLKL